MWRIFLYRLHVAKAFRGQKNIIQLLDAKISETGGFNKPLQNLQYLFHTIVIITVRIQNLIGDIFKNSWQRRMKRNNIFASLIFCIFFLTTTYANFTILEITMDIPYNSTFLKSLLGTLKWCFSCLHAERKPPLILFWIHASFSCSIQNSI